MMLRNPLPFALLYVILCLGYFMAARTVQFAPAVKCVKVLPVLMLMAGTVCTAVRDRDKGILTMAFALAFSAAGDVSCSFTSMMGVFAVAQVFYIVSFSRHFAIRSARQIAALGIWAVVAVAVLYFPLHSMIARGDAAALVVGGCVYMALLLGMSFTAIGQSRPLWILFAMGSLLFVLSDGTIALNRFVVKVPFDGLVVMVTYYAAQLLLNITTSTDIIDRR